MQTGVVFVLCFLFISGCSGYLWGDDVEEWYRQHKRCEGESMSIFTTPTMEDPPNGGTIASFVWLYIKNSERDENLLGFKDGDKPVNISNEYADRVTFIPPAGLKIDNLTSEDSGTYVVIIVVIFKDMRPWSSSRPEKVVVVSDDAMADLELTLQLDQNASKNWYGYDGEWYVPLRCGNFSRMKNVDPPQLIFPNGDSIQMMYREGDSFLFHFSAYDQMGLYTCSIKTTCGKQLFSVNASFEVELSAIEKAMMKGKLHDLQKTVEYQSKDIQQAYEKLQTVQDENEIKQRYLISHQSEMRKQEQAYFMLQQRYNNLAKQIDDLRTSQMRVSFAARRSNFSFSEQPTYPQPIIADVVLLNQGDCYDKHSGSFYAPSDGSYFFTITLTAGYADGRPANFAFWLVVNGGSTQDVNVDSTRQNTNALVLQTSVRLRKGQRVWIMSNDYDRRYRSLFFAGYLVQPVWQ